MNVYICVYVCMYASTFVYVCIVCKSTCLSVSTADLDAFTGVPGGGGERAAGEEGVDASHVSRRTPEIWATIDPVRMEVMGARMVTSRTKRRRM